MSTAMGELGARLDKPCPFCSGPRVVMRGGDDTSLFSATVCLRCDGPAPVRLPADPDHVDQQPPAAQP